MNDCGCTARTRCYANSLIDGPDEPTADCGCTPRTSYVAGYGPTERHEHDVRGSNACPVCAEFGACAANARRRESDRRWIAAYLGTAP